MAEQQIEQEGEMDKLINSFSISLTAPLTFSITLKNGLIGSVSGHGVIDAKTLAWEFKNIKDQEDDESFEGFEVYELQDNGDYMLHAEYFSGNQYRTIIDGRIWQKSDQGKI